MGALAVEPPKPGNTLSGILVKRNFNYLLLDPADLSSNYLIFPFDTKNKRRFPPEYSDMSISQVVQRQSMHYNGPMALLKHILIQLAGAVDITDDKKLRVFNCIDLSLVDKCVTLEVIFVT